MKSRRTILQILLFAIAGFSLQRATAETEKLAEGVRGVATRAPKEMKIDGDLSEFKDAFSTPLEYFQPDNKNSKDANPGLRDRAAQFFYMWDDEAFYAALRTLDRRPADDADD